MTATLPEASVLDAALPPTATMEHVLFEVKRLIVGQDRLLERLLVAFWGVGMCCLKACQVWRKPRRSKPLRRS